jgi:hypothetical protein
MPKLPEDIKVSLKQFREPIKDAHTMKKTKAQFENALLTNRQMQTPLRGSSDYIEEEPGSIGSTRLGRCSIFLLLIEALILVQRTLHGQTK